MFNDLVKMMCKSEAGKKQVNVAQMREILSKLSLLMVSHPSVTYILIGNGLAQLEKLKKAERAKYKKSKKK